ncbi:MAG: hypothetical protein K2W33_07330 [Burkholderiales bacterium]|nr:hypothetical protein [Burkholderiales bacterium]
MGRWTTVALVALGVWTAGALLSPAQANGVNWSFGLTVPGGAIVVGEHRPVAVYPAPVYRSHAYPVYPAPAYPAPVYPSPVYPAVTYPAYPAVVYGPPARVVAPAPWGYAPHRGYAPPPHHHRFHGRHDGYDRHGDDRRDRWDHR